MAYSMQKTNKMKAIIDKKIVSPLDFGHHGASTSTLPGKRFAIDFLEFSRRYIAIIKD